MSLLSVILAAPGALFKGSMTIQQPGTTTVHGVSVIDPDTYTTLATVQGALQPASDRALARAGIVGKSNLVSAFLEPTSVSAGAHRIVANNVTYKILDARAWATHTEALLEEVTA